MRFRESPWFLIFAVAASRCVPLNSGQDVLRPDAAESRDIERVVDAGFEADATALDATVEDFGSFDADPRDAGFVDTGPPDLGFDDSGFAIDGGPPDSGIVPPWRPAWAVAAGVTNGRRWAEFEVNGVRSRMMFIERGTYMQGSPTTEFGHESNEVQRRVAISHDFWMAETECTQRLWHAVMGGTATDPNHPAIGMTWPQAQGFMQSLNAAVTHLQARLPTEAEWEYACRAGSTAAHYGPLNQIAWVQTNQRNNHPVKGKTPNDWGLYDTLGNVWEWCADHYCEWNSNPVTDPYCGPNSVPAPDDTHVAIRRGGSVWQFPVDARAAERETLFIPDFDPVELRYTGDNVGFRIVIAPPLP